MTQVRDALVWLLRTYQRFLSPWLGTRCRFTPSCSQYAIEAVQSRGILRGVLLSVWRVLRCNPWHPGGHDPVPQRSIGAACRCTDHS